MRLEAVGSRNATPRVRSWLLEHYDPRTMPALQAAESPDRDGFWLIGWDHKATMWPPLLAMIFGQAYADHRIMLVNTALDLQKAIDAHGSGEYGTRTDREES